MDNRLSRIEDMLGSLIAMISDNSARLSGLEDKVSGIENKVNSIELDIKEIKEGQNKQDLILEMLSLDTDSYIYD